MHLSDVSLPSSPSMLLSPFSRRGKLRHKKVQDAAQNKWKNWDLKPGSVVPDPRSQPLGHKALRPAAGNG